MHKETFVILGDKKFEKEKDIFLKGGRITEIQKHKGSTELTVEHNNNLVNIRLELANAFSSNKVVWMA